MVAGSRVLLDVHWLSDVIAGLALGAAWFSICAIAFGGRLLRFGATADEAARVVDATPRPPHPRATSNVSPSVSFRGHTFDDRGHADSIGHEPRESADR